MSFNDIPPVGDPDFYLDMAFKRANEKAKNVRGDLKGTRLNKSKSIEKGKLNEIKTTLLKQLGGIIKSFPSFDDLDEFYKEMIKTFVDYTALKKALGGVNWVNKKIMEFTRVYDMKINSTSDVNLINKHRRDYYGRISSLLKRIKKELRILEETRKLLRGFPQVKTSLFTVAVVGFPNVGKTTLLSKLTGSKPEINSYAFTTKGINVGYFKSDNEKIQVLDTPGSLNRFNKMNAIEKQAYLAVKYCAEVLIYMFDPTLSYSLKEQEELLDVLKKFDIPVLFYLSKTDTDVDEEVVEGLKKKYKFLDVKELKEEIKKKV